MTRPSPTRHELQVLEAVLLEGSAKGAAFRLGIAEATVACLLRTTREKVGAASTLQAVWILRRELEQLQASPGASGSASLAAG